MPSVLVDGVGVRGRLGRKARATAGRLLRHLRLTGAILEVVFLSDREMRRMKTRHLGQKKTGVPNILTFSEPENFVTPPRKGKFLGEIYLNVDLIRRGKEDLGNLLTHGMLHLVGYRHKKRRDIVKMERAREKLLRALPKIR